MKYYQCPLVVFVFLLFVGFGCHAQAPDFNKQNAWDYLIKQCDLGYRHPGAEGHKECLNFMVTGLKQFADTVVKQPFPFTDPRTGQSYMLNNVIASFGKQDKRILLCAHWDTRPVADHDPDPANHSKPVMGASDGASGVAVLLEMARIFKENPPPVGVDIVLFDGEDSGVDGDHDSWCIGSRYFAKNKQSSYWPQYAILLDLIGDSDLQLPVEGFSQRYAPAIVDQVWSKASELGLYQFTRQVQYEIYDDHVELLKVGIPTVDIIDLDYPYWHTVEDTPDKCSAESLGVVGTLLVHLIYD